eukprot:CAMPEP_0197303994 /NCGR_PEP_ID=MMETSP0890-20130614/51999_1 /TAXON_ID=44058 ORGANISM="Aureoumbra lagunensis, Strain CCMP1510" /NCGR_SAMPLE_ID=MMETSP0890 /ASSEMBLY_ACC=CAM_ASM_000533 /LENGTH=77 /DNA_ID=CAMNT_0042783941 /DNA_START=1111 /DNA_END=1344 /DNA_ORIENTATION=+
MKGLGLDSTYLLKKALLKTMHLFRVSHAPHLKILFMTAIIDKNWRLEASGRTGSFKFIRKVWSKIKRCGKYEDTAIL